MQRCLQIQELIVNIFDYVLGGRLDQSNARTLAHLARTCKAFSNPALDALWYTQPTLFPLIKCFPQKILDINDKGNCLSFKRIPTIQDYERVNFYAPLIKELGNYYHFPFVGAVEIVVYSALLSQRSNFGPLLPKLQHLKIDLDDFFGQAAYARLVVGPNLRTIDLDCSDVEDYFDEATEYWGNISATLVEFAPNLRGFQFAKSDDWNFRFDTPAETMTLCTTFYDLRSLDIGHLNIVHNVLRHISKMPELTTLAFVIVSQELQAFTTTSVLPGEFVNVTSLKIFTDNLPPCTALFLRPGFRRLQKLTVAQCDKGGDWELEPFVTNLGTPDLQMLRLWRLLGDSIDEDEEGLPMPFTSSMLSSLLTLSCMTCLDITFNLSLQLRDADLQAMSLAWPRLTEVCLRDHTLQTMPELTFRGLLSLTNNCKELSTLKMRVDATQLPTFFTDGPLVPSNVTNLHLCTSPISKPMDFVQIVPLLFPNLSILNVSGRYKFRRGLNRTEKANADAWDTTISSLRPFVSSHSVFFRS